MFLRKASIAAICCAAAVLFASCSSLGSSKGTADSEISDKACNTQVSQQSQPDFNADIKQQAKLYDSSAGRIALSMIICKLDNSYAYNSLTQKSAKELFDILSETAFEKNMTLESLDSKYGLCKILASEKIYVKIHSNDVTSLPQASSKSPTKSSGSDNGSLKDSEQWIKNFQKAILQPLNS